MAETTYKWYHKPWVIVMLVLSVGPFGVIPLWTRPNTDIKIKLFTTIVVLFFTVIMINHTVKTIAYLADYYRQLIEISNEI